MALGDTGCCGNTMASTMVPAGSAVIAGGGWITWTAGAFAAWASNCTNAGFGGATMLMATEDLRRQQAIRDGFHIHSRLGGRRAVEDGHLIADAFTDSCIPSDDAR